MSDKNKYQWIDTSSIPLIDDTDRLVLFGCGNGTVDLLDYFKNNGIGPEISGLTDNDKTMWGKELHGYLIRPPQTLSSIDFTKIIITTVSGRDMVAEQLQGMGYEENVRFYRIGVYPASTLSNFLTLCEIDAIAPFLNKGDSILHIGPGGFFGLEVALYCLGYFPRSMDAYGFCVHYPEVTSELGKYESVISSLLKTSPAVQEGADTVMKRFENLINIRDDGRSFINTKLLPYTNPVRYSAIPVTGESQDVVCSLAVLEHVRNPAKAVQETARVLKKGGFAVHRIITRDHRSFGKISGYHPFSYFNTSEEDWLAINEKKFYQNRVLPMQWKALFAQSGFEIMHYREHEIYRLSEREIAHLHSDYCYGDSKLQPAFPETVNCDLLARRC